MQKKTRGVALMLSVVCGIAIAADSGNTNMTDTASTTDIARQIQNPLAEDNGSWEFKLMPYAWLPTTLKSKSTLSGLSGTVKLDLQDILDNLDMVFYGRLEGWKDDKWGLSYDTFYLNLGYDSGFEGSFSGTDFALDADIRMWMNDFAVHYRLVDQRFGDGDKQRFIFEPYGGLRYTYLRQIVVLDADIPGKGTAGEEFGDSRDWVEPLVGGRIHWDLNEKLALWFRGDAGGFGIGSASKLTYNIIPGCSYKLTENTTFDFSYRYFNMDYSNGSGSNELAMDVEAYGPVFGMTILF
jgi:opacity protein-like surface antigen